MTKSNNSLKVIFCYSSLSLSPPTDNSWAVILSGNSHRSVKLLDLFPIFTAVLTAFLLCYTAVAVSCFVHRVHYIVCRLTMSASQTVVSN